VPGLPMRIRAPAIAGNPQRNRLLRTGFMPDQATIPCDLLILRTCCSAALDASARCAATG
jgi:hypothetical protein